MSDNLENKNEGNELTESQKKEQELSEKLSKIETKLDDAGTLQKLMADPEVRAMLDAKQSGKKVKVVLDEEVIKPVQFELPDDTDYDNMTNKDLVKHVIKAISTGMESQLSSKLKPIVDQIKNVSEYIGSSEQKTAVQQVEAARKKFQDFDEHVPEMRELNKKNPGLNVEELYAIARLRKGGGVNATKVSSERPTNTSTKTPVKETRKQPLPPGKAGFDIALGEALETIEIPTDMVSGD